MRFRRLRSANRLAIFMYHGIVRTPLELYDWCFVSGEDFRRQAQYLRKRFEVLPLREAVDRLREGTIKKPSAAITFDDGFQNNHDVAFPILRKARLPATIFPVTGLIGSHRTLWFCRLHRALAATRKTALEWGGSRLDLAGPSEKSVASSWLEDRLKQLPQPELESETEKLVDALKDEPERPVEVDSPFRILDRDSIQRMTDSGLVELGGHTRSHAIVSLLSPEEQEREIAGSLVEIEALTGQPCEVFAYPNGRREDYDAKSLDILKSSRVRVAVTAIEGANDQATSPLELLRYGIGANLPFDRFKKKVDRIIREDLVEK